MRVKAVSGVILILLFVCMLTLVFDTKQVEAETVTWTQVATYHFGNYTSTILSMVIAPEGLSTSLEWAYEFAEEIANQTDYVVHLVDVRVGMALIWWELSQGPVERRMFPGRWTWDRLDIPNPPQACYDRLREAEEMAVNQGRIPADLLHVDWSFEAWKYYWNPGDPYFDIPDQPEMLEILRLEAGGYTGEFRAMFEAATVKAEEVAKATDKTVDLQDLRDAIAETIFQQYPNRYHTLADAQSRLEELEAITNIPEFPSFLILPLLMMTTIATVVYVKKRKRNRD